MALFLAAFGWGFRHGFDVDHLAAIGDLSTGAGRRRDAVLRATWYAAGHALVLLVLGAAAVLAPVSATSWPSWWGSSWRTRWCPSGSPVG